MSKEKLSIPEIIELMVRDKKTTKKTAEEFIKVLLSTVEDALLSGESVKINGLGTFKLHWNEARRSIDVNSGNEIIIPGFYRTVFVPENNLRELINEPFVHLETIQLPVEDNEEEISENKERLPVEEKSDSNLNFFTSQATEIKEILSDILALSAKKNIEDQESEVLEDDIEIEVKEEELADEDDATEEKKEENTEKEDEAEEDENGDEKDLENSPEDSENDFDIIRDVAVLYPIASVAAEKLTPKVEVAAEDIISETEVVEAPTVFEEKVEETVDKESVTVEEFSEIVESDQEIVEITEDEIEPVEVANDIETNEKIVFEEEDILETLDETNNEVNSEAETETISKEVVISEEIITTEEKEDTKKIEIVENEVINGKNNEEEEIVRKKPIVPIIVVALVVISLVAGWFLYPVITKAKKEKKNEQRLEYLADSVANEKRIKQISDSIYESRQDSAKGILESEAVASKIEDTLVSNPTPEVASAASNTDIYSEPRKFTENLAVEKIVPGSQLTRFARQYYNHPHFWVYIYEANKDKIADPNNVPVGIEVRIPKMDPMLVDPGNKKSLEYALKLQSQYLQ